MWGKIMFNFLASRTTQKRNKKLFECSKCNKKFASKKTLCNHKKVHDKTHQCEVCLKCFGTKYQLTVHMRTHTGEKPFVCSTCDKRCTTKSNLKSHQATHSFEKKIKYKVSQMTDTSKLKINQVGI